MRCESLSRWNGLSRLKILMVVRLRSRGFLTPFFLFSDELTSLVLVMYLNRALRVSLIIPRIA